MSTRLFSGRRLLGGRGTKKQSTESKSDEKPPENRLVLDPGTTTLENQIMEPKPDEKLSDNPRTAVPTTTDYITATGKQALKLLQSAASIIPVPLLREAIEVAVNIIELCEDASAVEQKVKELQDRVGHLMTVIVDHVTAKNEEGSKDAVVKAARGIEGDIKELLRTLGTINRDLTEISTQNRWVIAIYKELNTSTLKDCIDRLSTALERFKLANDLRDSDLLQKLQSRLEKIQRLTQHVADKVDNIDNKMAKIDDKVEDIHTFLFDHKRLHMPIASDTLVRQEMPLKPEIFHGRDDLVEGIARLLMTEETSHVCILGPGGMGKTAASLAVVEVPLVQERFPPGNRIWVPCIEATSAALLIEVLYVQLQVPGEKQVTLENIISELNASKHPCLILLDNFETPWNAPGGTQKQVGDILRKLGLLRHVAILVTMRGTYPPCDAIEWQSQTIQPTDEAACRRIFHRIDPGSRDDPDVDHLLTALGHMPFAVTLMAKLGKEGQSTAKELLDAWYKRGPDILPDQLEKSMNRTISLSVDSDLVKQNPDALLLLKILSLLPAGTTKENLRWWAPTLESSMTPSAIATLSGAALLVENKRQDSNSRVLFVLPVVQSFMQQRDRITEENRKQIQLSCCQFVLDHACRYDDSTFQAKSKALAVEDSNIQSILFGSPIMQHTISSDRTIGALIAFSWHRCDTKPNLDIANYAVRTAKASGIQRCIASAVWCLGRTYYHLGDHPSSYNHLQEAYERFNSLLPVNLESQQLGSRCGIDLVHAARVALQDKREAVSLARDIETRCAAMSDGLIHSRSLVVLGSALNEAQQQQEALVHLDHARTMLKTLGSTPNLATVCQIISRVHYHERRLPEALAAVEEAWRHAKSIDNPYLQAVVSREFGTILFSANRDTEAWEYIDIAFMKASHVGNQLIVARALEYMGYGYLRKGNYQNAYGAYETAVEKYLGTIDARGEKRCKDNMDRIKQKQGNADAIIGFYRPGFDIDESLFSPPIQASLSAVPISAS